MVRFSRLLHQTLPDRIDGIVVWLKTESPPKIIGGLLIYGAREEKEPPRGSIPEGFTLVELEGGIKEKNVFLF